MAGPQNVAAGRGHRQVKKSARTPRVSTPQTARKMKRRGKRYTPQTHCWRCKVPYEVIVRSRYRAHPFGWGTYLLRNGKRDAGRITYPSSLTQCPKCGDAFYTAEQADADSRACIRATLRLYRKRLGYRDELRRSRRPRQGTTG